MKKIVSIALSVLLMACSDKDVNGRLATTTRSKPVVVTSNYPLYFFAGEIAGGAVEVRLPSIEGDPAMWAPSGDEASKLQDAELLILNGAGYESWLAFTTLPGGHILDTTANLQSMLLPVEKNTVHQHGPEGEHSHQGTAFTTWLDPKLAIEQAREVTQGLSSLEPNQAKSFSANLRKLEQQLGELDQSLAQAFAALGEQPIIFSHPVYQYLQGRYGINGRSVHWEPDVEPGTRDWIELGNLLREFPATLMIWEGQPLPSVLERLREQGIRSIVFQPGGNRPLTGDYFTVMNVNLARLSDAN